jgi:hypothetical protein
MSDRLAIEKECRGYFFIRVKRWRNDLAACGRSWGSHPGFTGWQGWHDIEGWGLNLDLLTARLSRGLGRLYRLNRGGRLSTLLEELLDRLEASVKDPGDLFFWEFDGDAFLGDSSGLEGLIPVKAHGGEVRLDRGSLLFDCFKILGDSNFRVRIIPTAKFVPSGLLVHFEAGIGIGLLD